MGIDVLPESIEKGCTNLPSVNFQFENVLNSTLRSSSEFDKVFLTGVYMVFDEFETCFSNLIDWTEPGGSVYIKGMFNPYPVDVIIKYKHSVDYDYGYGFISSEIFRLLMQKDSLKEQG